MQRFLLSLFAVLLSQVMMAQFASAPAFPGAEGYGRFATGGRGGKVIHVTNLNDNGTGSLRAAVEAAGSRIVVFDVSGTIALRSRLTIKNPNITILGQTAPGDGIAIANYALHINTDNVIIRFIRCRMGDIYNVEDDAMSASHHDDGIHSRIIIDHCSTSWSTDECASFYGNREFTLQWCYITESLRISVHGKGTHGYGGIWGGQKASFHHNLLAHHDSRNARLDHDYVSTLQGPIDYVNNAIYNWGGNNCYGGETVKGKGFRKVNFIGNYYKAGPATVSRKNQLINATSNCSNCSPSDANNVEPAHFYLTGNVIEGNSDVTNNNWKGVFTDDKNPINVNTLKSETPFTSGEEKFAYNTISIQPAATAWQKVLDYAGCSYSRDAVDRRIASEALNGTYTYSGSEGSKGGLIDTQKDVGSWPNLNTYNKLADTDNDGMPDLWETANGLNPNADDSKEYTLDSERKYYTNIEVYANSIVEDQVRAQRADASETFEEYYPVCKKVKFVTEETVYASGTITWPMNDMSLVDIENQEIENGTIADALADYIESDAEVRWGSLLGLGSTTFADADGVNFIKFISGNADVALDGSEKSTFKFTVLPGDDYYFRPTAVEFYAIKDGTDAPLSLNAVYNNGLASTTVATADNLPRATKSSLPLSSAYHCNATLPTIPASKDTGTLSVILNGGGKDKTVGLSNVVITGDVLKISTKAVIDDPTGITTISASRPTDNVLYNLAGQRVPASTKGILILNGRKYINR